MVSASPGINLARAFCFYALRFHGAGRDLLAAQPGTFLVISTGGQLI
jgi:hypothetical protein